MLLDHFDIELKGKQTYSFFSNLEAIVLIDEALCSVEEGICGPLIPPVVKIAILIILSSIVVEPMRKFMPHYHSNSTIIYCPIYK